MDQNLKIKAIQSFLESKRDIILVELDSGLNNNNSLQVSVDYLVDKLKELTLINETIETFNKILKDNEQQKNTTLMQAIKEAERINEQIKEKDKKTD